MEKGVRFGKLTILEFSHKSESGKYFWKCLCDCGKSVHYRSDILKSKRRKSCGCIKSPNHEDYKKNLEKRLLNNSIRNGECLEWQKGFNPGGYGIMKIRSNEMKGIGFSTGPHRVAYYVWIGEIPKGMYVLHKCDNRKCIEPSHLFLGTHQDNMNDKVKKNRQHFNKGEIHGMSILTNEIILEMRRLWDEGFETQTNLSKIFGISLSCAHNIVKRKTWKHLP